MSYAWLILLLAWPLIEIAVLIKAGGWLGFWLTLGIVVGTGMMGTAVLMRYGIEQARKLQEAMGRGEPPLLAMMDGALVATAGILLIVPGLCADALGLVLLIPPVRTLLSRWLLRSMLGLSEVDIKRPKQQPAERGPQPSAPFPPDGPVIEGEFERIDERTLDPGRRRPSDDREPR